MNVQRRCLLALVLLGVALPGCAARQPEPVRYTVTEWSAHGWQGRHLSSDRIDVYSTLDDRAFEAGLPRFLEAAMAWYRQELPFEDEDARLRFLVLGHRSQWEAFTRDRFPEHQVYAGIRTGGYTGGGISVACFVNRSATLATLAHEGWHQYLARRVGRDIPAWLNEGLACYYEAVDLTGDAPRLTPTRNGFRLHDLRQAIRRNHLLPLGRLLEMEPEQVIAQGRPELHQAYYAQVWALIVFLRHGAERRFASAFDQLLDDLLQGSFHARVRARRLVDRQQEKTAAQAAFTAYFGAAPAALNDEFHDFMNELVSYNGVAAGTEVPSSRGALRDDPSPQT